MSIKKNDLPAMPMYWGDWFKAPDVQSLPRDIRCVWFEMIGRMWESNERGYLTVNGKPMSDFAKANLFGFGEDIEKYRRAERLIEEHGIFSRREDSAIFCRSMVKNEEIRLIRKQAGSKGGSKTQSKIKNKLKQKIKQNTENENENENENVIEDKDEIKNEKRGDYKEGKTKIKNEFDDEIDQAIDYANETWDKEYQKQTEKTRTLLRTIFKKEHSLEDVKKVIELKLWESQQKWKNGQPMFNRKYLRPETVFNYTKFEGYLNDVNDYEKNKYQKNGNRTTAETYKKYYDYWEKAGFKS